MGVMEVMIGDLLPFWPQTADQTATTDPQASSLKPQASSLKPYIVHPPSITWICPVVKADASDAR